MTPYSQFLRLLLAVATAATSCSSSRTPSGGAVFVRSPNHGPGACCGQLGSALPSQVSYPNSSVYEASLSSYWAQAQHFIEPSCVFQPRSSEDVSVAIRLLVPGNCQFAVRSGGHGSVTGTANVQDGVTIDLSLLNGTVLRADKTEVSIGGGQRLGNVYTYLADYGLAIAGARDSSIGIGGSTLGGIGFFGPANGFAADSVIEYEVVLADGRIVTANESQNPDLWKALKGGGGNFGIVTGLVFSTFPLGNIWASDVQYLGSAVNATANALYNFVANPDYDPHAAILVTYNYSPNIGGIPIIAAEYTYDLPVPDAPAFEEFASLPDKVGNTSAITTLNDFSVVADATSPDGYQQITFSMSFNNSAGMILKVWDIFDASLAAIQAVDGISWSLTLEPIVSPMLTTGTAKGGNSLGIELPPDGLILVLCSATFLSSSDYEYVSKQADQLLESLISAAQEREELNSFIDMNHAKAGQDPIAGYGVANHDFLKAVAQKYDPRGHLQTLKPGGFKL